eukprot:PhF_6_TR13698/c0_g1_i1/m.22094
MPQQASSTALLNEPDLVYITVRVPEVRRLPKKALRSSITPFLRLRVGLVEHRSSYGTSFDPKFQDEFVFAISTKRIQESQVNGENLTLNIRVCDYIRYGFSDDFGDVSLPVHDVINGVFSDGKWFPLAKKGAVEFVMSKVRTHHSNVLVQDSGPVCLVYADVASMTAPQRTTIGQVSVNIMGATKLRHHTAAVAGGKEKYFSPYAVIQYEKSWGMLPTRVNTNNPVWESIFTFPVCELSSVVSIALFDNRKKQMRKDKLLGLVKIRLSTLIGNTVYSTENYPLYIVRDNYVRVMGLLRMSIGVEYFVPLKSVVKSILSPTDRFYRTNLSARLIQKIEKAKMLRVQTFLREETPSIPMEVSEAFMDLDNAKSISRKFGQSKLRISAALTPVIQFVGFVRAVQRWELPLVSLLVNLLWPFLVYHTNYIPIMILVGLITKLMLGFRTRWYSAFPLHPDVSLSNFEIKDVGGKDSALINDDVDSDEEDAPTANGAANESGANEPQLSALKKIEVKLEELRGTAALANQYLDELANMLERVQSFFHWEDPLASAIVLTAWV